MPLRFGEMVLIIRTQDFASRNLDRISASLGQLSRAEQLTRRRTVLAAQEADQLSRRARLSGDLDAIRMLQRRVDLQQQLNKAVHTTGGLRTRNALGQFINAAPLVAELTTIEKAMDSMPQRVLRLANSFGLLRDRAATLEPQLAATDRRLKIIQSDIVKLDAAMKALRWEKLHRMGQTASRLGRIMQLTGLIATGSFVAMGNAAANFTAEATLAATQARDLGGDTKQVMERSLTLQRAITDQMQRFPVSADQMAGAAYEIFSSLNLMNEKGLVNVAQGIRILEKANKAAVAGGVDLDESIKGVIITLNNFDEDLSDVQGTLDTMFDIVRFGNIHFSDLTTIMSKVAPASKAVGHTIEDISGALAQLTRNLPPQMVSAGFAQLESTFADPDFQEGIRVLSKARFGSIIDITEAGKLKEPLEILRDILTVFPELARGELETKRFFRLVTSAGTLSRTGRETTGREMTIQQRRVLESLVQNFATVEELQQAIRINQGELNAAFAAMMKDPGVQWKIFLSQMRALALEIGTMALPALLRLADVVQRVVQWFRSLSPETRNLIVQIGVFGSAATLVVGVLGSMIGGIMSLIGSMGILGKSLTPLLMLGRTLAFMAGIGAIAIILKTAITGDATAWDFIMGAMLGATAGSIFGPAGAIIGGITVPVILQFMDERPQSPFEKAMSDFQDMQRNRLPGILDWIKPPDAIMPIKPVFDEQHFREQWAILMAKAQGKLPPNVTTPIDPAVEQLFNKYKKDIPALQQSTEKWSTTIQKLLKSTKNKAALTEFNKLLKTVPQLEQMFKRTGDEAEGMANAIASGMAEGERQIEQAVDRLSQIFEQFRTENTQAFGELFRGPFFQSETWSLAQEWDVQPAIRDIKKDLQMQITAFKQYRQALNALSKRKGVTPDLIKELRALGPEAMPYLEGLRKAAPGAFNRFISLWKQKHREIEKATKIDFNKQLAQWNKFGSDIALQIILGLRSEDAALDKAFEQYITSKFPKIIENAKKAAIAEFKRQQAIEERTKKEQGNNKGGGTKTSGTTGGSTTSYAVTQTIVAAPGEKTKDVQRRARHEAERFVKTV